MTIMQTCLRPVLALHLTRIREAGPLAYRNESGPLEKALEHLAATVDDPSGDECWFHAQAMESAQAGRLLVALYLADRILTGASWREVASPVDTGHGQVLTVAPEVAETFVHILDAAQVGAKGLVPRMLSSMREGLAEAQKTGSVEWWHHQVVLFLTTVEKHLGGAGGHNLWQALWTVLPQLIDCGEVANYAH